MLFNYYFEIFVTFYLLNAMHCADLCFHCVLLFQYLSCCTMSTWTHLQGWQVHYTRVIVDASYDREWSLAVYTMNGKKEPLYFLYSFYKR